MPATAARSAPTSSGPRIREVRAITYPLEDSVVRLNPQVRSWANDRGSCPARDTRTSGGSSTASDSARNRSTNRAMAAGVEPSEKARSSMPWPRLSVASAAHLARSSSPQPMCDSPYASGSSKPAM